MKSFKCPKCGFFFSLASDFESMSEEEYKEVWKLWCLRELAKILKQNGVDIGQNRLFEWMRENGYLIKRKGTDYNMPMQRAMEMGLFEIKERTINNPDGSVRITKTVLVSGKGQQHFINKFLGAA